MSLLLSFLFALAAAMIVVNVFQTWVAYPQLPDRVPLQFNWNGQARSYGPRFMIWLTVAIQICVAVGMGFTARALTTHTPGTHGTLPGFAIFAVLFNAMIWRVQTLLISVAKSGGKRAVMNSFYVFFAVWFALFLIDVFAIG